MIIGITGGVGSGKSAIMEYVYNKYISQIYKADEISNSLIKVGNQCYHEIVEVLGDGILDSDGSINKNMMASRIFEDNATLSLINSIIHPRVKEYIIEVIEEYRNADGRSILLIEAALLIEDGYKKLIDEMWYISADIDIRINRLVNNRGYSYFKAKSIIDNQLSDEEYVKASDVVIDNSGDILDTYIKVDSQLNRCGALLRH